jgi:15-cis-phytoene synthase
MSSMPDVTTTNSEKPFKSIFRNGSRTYFFSSMFFAPAVREDVSVLYAFVRVVDNFVDSIPQNRLQYYQFKEEYRQRQLSRLSGKAPSSPLPVIDAFLALMQRHGISSEWVDAFFSAMELDITCAQYQSINDTITYMYGSAEVIGLMMARILDLPESSYIFAQLLGRSMQYINFIRDIEEDFSLGRTYLPQEVVQSFGFSCLSLEEVSKKREAFHQLITQEIKRYLTWKEEAEKGYHFIPRRYLIPIKTASDMYAWTAHQLMKDPFLLYQTKVKPTVGRIMAKGSSNAAYVLLNVPR